MYNPTRQKSAVQRYEVLNGLPPYGSPAETFTATGQGAHREGFVVCFTDDDGDQWVGNFQPGLGGINAVLDHPDGLQAIVIAGGQGYLVDPNDRTSRNYFGGQIESVIPLAEFGLIVCNGLWFEAIGPEGPRWTSERVSWDGMRNFEIKGRTITGEAWDPIDDRWVSFELDLATGSTRGGSFEGYRVV